MPEAAKPSMAKVIKYFGKKPGQSLAEFKKDEWDTLSDTDKTQLAEGIADESFTY